MILLLFATTILCMIYYLTNILVQQLQNEDENKNDTVDVNIFNRSTFNCADSKIPCVTDSQCYDYCNVTSIGNKHTCLSGFCSTVTNENNNVNCNEKHGLFSIYTSTSELIRKDCISLYRDLYDDYDELRPVVCENGTFDIDLTVQNISVDNCVCDDDYTLMSYIPTIYSNIMLVCVKNNLVSLYNKIYNEVNS
ncbi:unknown [Neodiprion lecontei nucleopolyhedrovirus]|uniref:Pif-3 n=1 Tax=Neodiprion lecontei nucleopolyhedrovirus (strain Canada) TaxID=654906 RepID=Q6JPA2_NPVNC|nr:unknown [Neodiprion lecontei nucleopolyhedrovirus]AAQ99101.1 unknown [Neodiprion lecontei nucleopolyhedrovirus]